MVARFRSWWQQIKPHPVATVLIALLAVVIVLIILSILGYIFNWDWTGLGPYISPPHPEDSDFQRGKTLWDWLQLLFIPVVLAVAGFWFNHRERKAAELRAEAEREIEQKRTMAEQEIASDNQREASLQAYINEMSELLLHENLRESKLEHEVRKIARVRTLTVLPRLDGVRKGSVLQFLYESRLIDKNLPIIDLTRADLSGVYLIEANLRQADLSEANLKEAILTHTRLTGADLSEANLYKANLFRADLSEANLCKTHLSRANLKEANLSEANLSEVSLREANLIGTYLREANLSEVWMIEADLRKADLRYTDLSKTFLSRADLSGAKLKGAIIAQEELDKAKSLKGATMPDGSIHP